MATYTLYWVRADQQGDYNMGEFDTREAAEAAIPTAKAELIDQCPGPVGSEDWSRCAAEIEDGDFVIAANEDDDDDDDDE